MNILIAGDGPAALLAGLCIREGLPGSKVVIAAT